MHSPPPRRAIETSSTPTAPMPSGPAVEAGPAGAGLGHVQAPVAQVEAARVVEPVGDHGDAAMVADLDVAADPAAWSSLALLAMSDDPEARTRTRRTFAGQCSFDEHSPQSPEVERA